MSKPHGQPQQVLWLVKGLGPGGAEQLLVNQAQVRDRESFVTEAAYLVPWKNHLVARLAAEGVPAACLGSGRDWDLRWVWRLRRRLTTRPVDVIHHHSPLVGSITRLLARTLPKRIRPGLVYTEHNRWPRHNRLTRALNRATFSLDDQTFAVSDDVRETIPHRLRNRVEVLVHGVDVDDVRSHLDDREEMRTELGFGTGEVVIGIVANFRREKAYEVWVEAARQVVESMPTVRFVSVGQGPLEDTIRTAVTALGLDDAVRILGYRDDALRVMSAFDVFTLSSRHEGLPVSLMEALVLGLPVVATDVGGVGQAVTNGVQAILVPPDDADALAAAYRQVASDPALRARLAQAATDRGEDFGMDTPTRRLERAYVEVAAKRRA